MHHADIKALLHKKGTSPAKVARKMRVHRSAVSMVIRGSGKSRRIASAIATLVGLPVSQLWPGAYGEPRRNAYGTRRLSQSGAAVSG